MTMKLTVLCDNSTFIDMYYLGEPALSFYIEDDDCRILFDTGYSDVFLRNAEKMGIDLAGVSQVVISHGHNDHNGGLRFLPQKVKDIDLIAHPGSFEYKEDDHRIPIGSFLSRQEIEKDYRLQLTDKPLRIGERFVFLGEIETANDFENRKPIGHRMEDDGLKPDLILDDSALVYEGRQGLFIITGCSHSGICNIIEYAKKVCGQRKIAGVIGGFHLFEQDGRLEKTIGYLKENQIPLLYPCHCVSLKAKIAMGQQLDIRECGVGLRLEYE